MKDTIEEDPVYVRPIGWVLRSFSQRFRGELLPVDSRKFCGEDSLLGVEAVASRDGGEVRLVLVNRDDRLHEVLMEVQGTGCHAAAAFDMHVSLWEMFREGICEGQITGSHSGVLQRVLAPYGVLWLTVRISPAPG